MNAAALLLLGLLLVALIRVIRGPERADRLMTAQLFGTAGAGIMLLLADTLRLPALLDVALVFALLGAVAIVTFALRVWNPRS
jgi:multicomponent Na+:H+ antiporter subunit F